MNIKMDSKRVGCYIDADNNIHIGNLSTRKTVCGQELTSTLFDEQVDVNCSKCLDKFQKKRK